MSVAVITFPLNLYFFFEFIPLKNPFLAKATLPTKNYKRTPHVRSHSADSLSYSAGRNS